jgi:PKHD-type hydroxylase
MFALYKEAIPHEICDLIIKFGLEQIANQDEDETTAKTGGNNQKSKKNKIAVTNMAAAEDPKHSYIRDTSITWFTKPWIFHLFNPYIDQANKENLNLHYDITMVENPQFSQYLPPKFKKETGQFYGWHQDSGTIYEDNTERKLSLVCALSDSTEYEEGDLVIDMGAYKDEDERYENCKEKMKKGSIIVMTSNTWHMVKPITKGKRYSLVMWARGPRFK